MIPLDKRGEFPTTHDRPPATKTAAERIAVEVY